MSLEVSLRQESTSGVQIPPPAPDLLVNTERLAEWLLRPKI